MSSEAPIMSSEAPAEAGEAPAEAEAPVEADEVLVEADEAPGMADERASLTVGLGDPPELRVDEVVERRGLGARVGHVEGGAGEGLLVEHRLVAADEGEVGGLVDDALVIGERQAHVVHLAVIVDVGVVAVGAAVAGEGGLERRREVLLRQDGELPAVEAKGRGDQREEEAGGAMHGGLGEREKGGVRGSSAWRGFWHLRLGTSQYH